MTIFGHFCEMRIFSKKSGCQTKLYKDPQDQVKFQKKLMTQFRENLQTNRRTDGRTDRPCIIGPFRPRLGVQKEYNYHYRICLNMSECANINWILNMSWVLYMPKFRIWQSSQHASNIKHSECGGICLGRFLNIS